MFLHGGGPGCSAWTDFGPVAPLFAADRRCHLVDLLQYGKSDKTAITGPRWSYLAKSMVGLLDELGEERVDVVCNSWGGTIAIAMAAEYPDRVRSLVVTGSMPVFYGPLAPLPEGGRRGRNAPRRLLRRRRPDAGEDAPTDRHPRVVRRRPHPRRDRACATSRASSRASAPRLVAPTTARGMAGPRGPLSARIRCRDAVLLGHARRLLDTGLPADARPHGPPRPALRDGPASHHLQEERPHDYYRIVTAFIDMDHAP